MNQEVLAPCLPFAAQPVGSTERLGVLLIHGFTGCPASLRPWAEHLAAQGRAVELPRLPGHGTRWQEMTVTRWPDWYHQAERSFHQLAGRSSGVVVAGLSMGGALALRLAQRENVAGLVLVNPAIATHNLSYRLLPILSRFVTTVAAIGDDIKLPGHTESSYPRTPLAPASSMTKLWADVRAHLGQVNCPVLLTTSREDHVVDDASGRILAAELPEADHRWLADSYHVATLDHDAGEYSTGPISFWLSRNRGQSR